MDKARLMRIGFVVAFAALLALAAAQDGRSQWTSLKTVDATPCFPAGLPNNYVNDFWTAVPTEPRKVVSLQDLATQEADFRACDRDWNTPSPDEKGR